MSLLPVLSPHRLLSVLAGITLTLTFAVADDRQPVPDLHARVTDQTNTLNIAQTQSLTSELEALEKRKGSQIGVLIVPTTQPEDIAQYSIRVFDVWKLGRKRVDDGVLLVVAKDDHRVRIEVARGLEGAIPDAAAARIIREYITPKFRAGDFFSGIHDATGALVELVDGESLPEPKTKWTELPFAVLLSIFLFPVVFALFSFLLRLHSSFLPDAISGLVLAIVFGGAQFELMRLFGVPTWLTLATSLCTAFASLFIGGLPQFALRGYGRSSGGGSSSFSSSSGSGDDSSSSSSDSSFSGGGGESAGGGASGSW